MKKVLMTLLLLILVFNNAFTQVIIENPDKPLSENAGRELKLQEVFVYHTCEYQITHVDLKKGRILKTFNRKYPRMKHVVTEWEEERTKKHNAPKRKYENDITGLFLHKEQLWINTSTIDEEKRLLIDLFDKEGQYIDCFYLSIPGSIKAVWDNYIFTIEKDIDENLQIVQYKIIE